MVEHSGLKRQKAGASGRGTSFFHFSWLLPSGGRSISQRLFSSLCSFGYWLTSLVRIIWVSQQIFFRSSDLSVCRDHAQKSGALMFNINKSSFAAHLSTTKKWTAKTQWHFSLPFPDYLSFVSEFGYEKRINFHHLLKSQQIPENYYPEFNSFCVTFFTVG